MIMSTCSSVVNVIIKIMKYWCILDSSVNCIYTPCYVSINDKVTESLAGKIAWDKK
jgi:hypothetical protein